MPFVELFQDIFHFLIISYLCNSDLFQKTNAFLHSFIETDILGCQFILIVIIAVHDGIVFIVIGCGPDGFEGLLETGLWLANESAFDVVKIDTAVKGYLAAHEGFLVVRFENCVLPWVWVEDFLFGLHLATNINVVDFTDKPFTVLSD